MRFASVSNPLVSLVLATDPPPIRTRTAAEMRADLRAMATLVKDESGRETNTLLIPAEHEHMWREIADAFDGWSVITELTGR